MSSFWSDKEMNMTETNPSLRLGASLACVLGVLAVTPVHAQETHGKVLRRGAGRPERLRRRSGHDLRRHLDGRLSGQRLEAGPGRHLRHDGTARRGRHVRRVLEALERDLPA